MGTNNSLPSINWAQINTLPNIAFIRSLRGSQTIADVQMALWDSSPLWEGHLARIDVYALSSPKALREGLLNAIELCNLPDELWVIALVRGGGASETMEKFADVLLSDEVKPLLEILAPRLIFAAGHTQDADRYGWLRDLCLAFGHVPLEAGCRFVEVLSGKGVFQKIHQNIAIEKGLPLPSELYRVNQIIDRERLVARIEQRYKKSLDRALIIDDREFIEMIVRGGILIGFIQITDTDYRAIGISQDYLPYQSDSYYDLETWKANLESILEDWEIEEAIDKTGIT